MELATGPLPSRATMAMPAEHRVDAWGDFLHRTLVSVGTAVVAEAAALVQDSAPPEPALACMCVAEADTGQ